MKTLYESILSSTSTGKSYYADYIKKHNIGTDATSLDEITFKDFLDVITPELFTTMLKRCWRDAAKDYTMGRYTIRFSDGYLGIEIMTMPSGFRTNGGKWWREAFVKSDEYNEKKKLITSYDYMDAYHKSAENGCCTFKTEWGDRLNKIMPNYIEYLKEHYKDLVK